MGRKVHPVGYRIGINKNWKSRWFAPNVALMNLWLIDDDKINKYFINQHKSALIDRVEIERPSEFRIDIFVYSAAASTIANEEKTKSIILDINKIVGKKYKINLNIVPLPTYAWSARLVARKIADDIENRVSFRIAQKNAIKEVLESGAKGVKTKVGGRLGGVELARTEGYSKGDISLSTIRSDLDFAVEESYSTKGGMIGVKVWINRGEILEKGLNNQVDIKKAIIKEKRVNRFNNKKGENN